MNKRGEYGEPWEVNEDIFEIEEFAKPTQTSHSIWLLDKSTSVVAMDHECDEENRRNYARMRDCVNALDGREPEALRALEKAVREYLEIYDAPSEDSDASKMHSWATMLASARQRMRAALDELEGDNG